MPRVETLQGAPGFIIHGRGHGKRGTLIQTDWDYPATAEGLGWSLARVQVERTVTDTATGTTRVVSKHLARRPSRTNLDQGLHRHKGKIRGACRHTRTDGTIDCPECGVTAGAFIRAAADYLAEKAGW